MAKKSLRTEQMKAAIMAQVAAQKVVETDEVVHMRMGDENVTDTEQFTRGKGGKISKVEKQGPFLQGERDKEGGVSQGAIDETRREPRRYQAGGRNWPT
jgi:hypothetical protein